MGEECWLYFIDDYHQVTDMPLLLTRMFGHMMTAFIYLLEAKRLSLARIPLTRI
jgi:hypothetical protein